MFLAAVHVLARSPEDVPGAIVHRLPVPSLWDCARGRAVYTASPSIVVSPKGEYLVSSNPFGRGSNANVSGTTFIHRSNDRGATWHLLTTLHGMKRGSLFVLNGVLYIWGYTAAPGSIVIRKSHDSGQTWTTPTDARNGLLRAGKFGGTPCIPAVHDGRLWLAQGGNRVMSAPVEADLLQAEVWTLSRAANMKDGPLGEGLTVTEAQVVAAPHTGVVLLPKIKGHPCTVLLRVGDQPSEVRNPKHADWVGFLGGEKKFGATYDPATATFYALSNPVLSEFANCGWPPELVRNTLALLSSKDLRTWRMERIVLQSPNVDYEAFQYPAFAIDGDDLLIALRTAYDLGGRKPPRGHDSNLITFFRLQQFRSSP
jgi:hypothetical protein